MNTQFTEEERLCIIVALEELQASNDLLVRKELQKVLIQKSLDKLEYLSAFTVFTKQELTIMYFALHRFRSMIETCDVVTDYDDVIDSALEKTYKAAQPNA